MSRDKHCINTEIISVLPTSREFLLSRQMTYKQTEFLEQNADDGHWQNQEEELVGPQMNDDQSPEQPDQTVVTDGSPVFLSSRTAW